MTTESKDIVCSRCGSAIDVPEASFCPVCGAPLRRVEDVTWSVSDVFKVLLLSFLVFILSIIAVTFSFHLLSVIDLFDSIFTSFMFLSLFHIILLSFTIIYLRRRGGGFRSIGFRRIDRRIIGVGIISGLIILVANMFISMLLQPIIGTSPIQEEVYRLISKPGIQIAMLILSTVLAPFVEEVYFRGFSYQAFKKSWGTKTAILLCSVFFSILHMDPWSIPHTFIVGVILTLVYEKTGNLNAAVIAHSMNNLLAVLIYLFT
jgi:membrane protease YdiL (CAAX protease family)